MEPVLHKVTQGLFKEIEKREAQTAHCTSLAYQANSDLCKIKCIIEPAYSVVSFYNEYASNLRIYYHFNTDDLKDFKGFSTQAIRDILMDEAMDALSLNAEFRYTKSISLNCAAGSFTYMGIHHIFEVYGEIDCKIIKTEKVTTEITYKC